MLVKITDDLYIDPLEVKTVEKYNNITLITTKVTQYKVEVSVEEVVQKINQSTIRLQLYLTGEELSTVIMTATERDIAFSDLEADAICSLLLDIMEPVL